MGRYITISPKQTMALGETLAQGLRGGEIIAFTGGMGVGKTTFCRGIAKGLGSTDPVQSPTFGIANYYRGAIPFAHFDAYRATGEEDLEAAGFYEYLEAGAVAAVEWSEQFNWPAGPGIIYVKMDTLEEEQREIIIEGAAGL